MNVRVVAPKGESVLRGIETVRQSPPVVRRPHDHGCQRIPTETAIGGLVTVIVSRLNPVDRHYVHARSRLRHGSQSEPTAA